MDTTEWQEGAEQELLGIVRGDLAAVGSDDLKVTIERKNGHWYVTLKSQDLDGASGDGATFGKAWQSMIPNGM